MKVKKYIAKDMSEAMTKIRGELGSDAVILNSKRVESGGFFGLFTKKNIEVIAAIDPEIKTQPKEKVKPRVRARSEDTTKLSREIKELKSLITTMQSHASEQEYPAMLESINTFLKEQDIADTYRLTIMKRLLKSWYTSNEGLSEEEINAFVKEELLALLPDKPRNAKRYLNVFGPTGVGKTTTIAKIASHAVIKENKKVAFITTDTFRIAAIEQLKTYAKILDVPVEVAYTIEDFKKAVDQFNDYDFILIDSAGRNFRNPLYVNQLKEIINFQDDMENHLVLSLTSKYRDMKKIVEQFQLISIDHVIFTKADETDTVGAMLSISADYHLAPSFITNGQNVPDDLEVATPTILINKVMESGDHG
ncbi:flagellar biosynthesis protein FlhF [Paenalkalicoccus suaedae]|uniref:Flagellar biosynthesis protein FlhF n=1 Tax=Paenalkalicoccus suaedae TaxID=2592382 RepID=A0A859FEX6_9BACI|nr:flagellar biosynthesis protein FlhF [Paenalkalicoccus suaedae]QKS71420.1 flagellar biosynthesis protein FlhF [Paenalkalicoccus suaedae]